VDWSTNYDTVGGGGLMTSVDDLLLWKKDFYQNKLGKGALLIELQTRGVLNKSRLISHGLGLGLGAYRGLPIQEHNGANFGYRAEILRFPERGSRWCALEVGRQVGLSDIGPREGIEQLKVEASC
jgi:hypothetical protein